MYISMMTVAKYHSVTVEIQMAQKILNQAVLQVIKKIFKEAH